MLTKVIKSENGITLIELLATLIILAIITAIAIPAISVVINNSRDKAILSDIISFVNTAEIAITEGACGNDSICTYSGSNNEIGFETSKFSVGKVDFQTSKTPEGIKIQVNVGEKDFKGRHAKKYADIVADSKIFTKKELLALTEK